MIKVRKIILEQLKVEDYLLKAEDYIHKVGHSERTNAVIEPRLSKQWFLKMENFAKPALQVVKDKEIKFHPNRWEKIYNHWLNIFRTGVFQDNYGGGIEFLYGIRMTRYIVILFHLKEKDGLKKKMSLILGLVHGFGLWQL